MAYYNKSVITAIFKTSFKKHQFLERYYTKKLTEILIKFGSVIKLLDLCESL